MTTCSTDQIDSMPTRSAVVPRCVSISGYANGPALAYISPNFMSALLLRLGDGRRMNCQPSRMGLALRGSPAPLPVWTCGRVGVWTCIGYQRAASFFVTSTRPYVHTSTRGGGLLARL